MENQIREKRTRSYLTTRAVVDFTMGLLILACGLYFCFGEKFGFKMPDIEETIRYIFGVMCIIYGSWRVFRGYKKEYY